MLNGKLKINIGKNEILYNNIIRKKNVCANFQQILTNKIGANLIFRM